MNRKDINVLADWVVAGISLFIFGVFDIFDELRYHSNAEEVICKFIDKIVMFTSHVTVGLVLKDGRIY